jgi:hypothetical protein
VTLLQTQTSSADSFVELMRLFIVSDDIKETCSMAKVMNSEGQRTEQPLKELM